jgi:hypothetical protein
MTVVMTVMMMMMMMHRLWLFEPSFGEPECVLLVCGFPLFRPCHHDHRLARVEGNEEMPLWTNPLACDIAQHQHQHRQGTNNSNHPNKKA